MFNLEIIIIFSVVGADKLSKITDLTDRSTAVLFGDGAGAVIIGEVSEGRGIISYEMGSDGTGGKTFIFR